MGVLNTFLSVVTWWKGATLNTRLYTARHGIKVGEDVEGNTFYRNADGTKRWVIYNGEVEASRINSDWHGWLHHTFDQPPTEAPLAHKPWEEPHHENLTGSALAYVPAGSLYKEHPKDRSDYEAWSPE